MRAYAARAFASRLADLRALAPIGARGQVAPSALPRGAPAALPYPTPPQPRRPAPVQRRGSAECRASFSGDCRYDVNHRYFWWRLICLPDKPFRRQSESEPRWLSARLMIHPDVAQILGHVHDAGNHLGTLPPSGDGRQASRFDGCVKCATLRGELACRCTAAPARSTGAGVNRPPSSFARLGLPMRRRCEKREGGQGGVPVAVRPVLSGVR